MEAKGNGLNDSSSIEVGKVATGVPTFRLHDELGAPVCDRHYFMV